MVESIETFDMAAYLASLNPEDLDRLLSYVTATLSLRRDTQSLTSAEWASAKTNHLSASTVRNLIVVLESIPNQAGFQGQSTGGNAPTALCNMVGFKPRRTNYNPWSDHDATQH